MSCFPYVLINLLQCFKVLILCLNWFALRSTLLALRFNLLALCFTLLVSRINLLALHFVCLAFILFALHFN